MMRGGRVAIPVVCGGGAAGQARVGRLVLAGGGAQERLTRDRGQMQRSEWPTRCSNAQCPLACLVRTTEAGEGGRLCAVLLFVSEAML